MHGFCCYGNIHVCKLIALYTADAYSAKREMLPSACNRSVAGLVLLSGLESSRYYGKNNCP